MWGEGAREGSNPILIRGGFDSAEDGGDERIREDYRRDGSQDPESVLRSPDQILTEFRQWERARKLPQSD
eukprot:8477072-Alexandrium_andersonii.AAC.1